MERLGRHQQEGRADHCHEQGGNERHGKGLAFERQIDGNHPQREYGEGLVGPSEILPDDIETIGILNLPHQQGNAHQKQRNTDQETAAHGLLRQMQIVGYDETAGTESGVTARNRGCHHTQQGEDATGYAQPLVADDINNLGG